MISIITVESCAGQPFAAMAQHASMAMQTAIALNQWNNVSSPFHVGLVPMQPDDPYSRSSADAAGLLPWPRQNLRPRTLHCHHISRDCEEMAKKAPSAHALRSAARLLRGRRPKRGRSQGRRLCRAPSSRRSFEATEVGRRTQSSRSSVETQ